MTETAAPDYRQMWTDIGLDLESHDVLLAAVGQLYGAGASAQPPTPQAGEAPATVQAE